MKRLILYIVFLLISFEGLGQTLPTPQNPSASIDYYNTVSLNFSFDATGLFPAANTGQTLYFEIEIDNGTTQKTFRTSNYTFATPNNAYSFSKTLAHGFSYTFKVKAFFKESTFGATTTSNQSSQSNVITATNPRGVTVLTHGFAGGGSLDASWKANARALRNRLSSETGSGKGATILINNTSTGLWEFLEGENGSLDLNEEIIFLFDWAEISRTPLLGNQTGYLESAADVLYSILINPNVRMSNGQLTQLGASSPGQLLLDKNSHFIGHSRGTIVMLQLLHRLKSNFSAINIERLTLLDPHPAGTFGDVKRADVNGSPENLPGVHGAATTCGIFLCYDGGQSVYLTVPDNVLKVEDFYRQGWAYEPPAEVNGGISPFMGVPLIGGNNSYLMNNNIMNAGAGDAGFLGGAHSAVPTWYFQTVDLSLPLSSTQSDWFSTLVGPFMTGKTRATAGYNITNLPNIPIKATLSDYNNALNIRTGQAALAKVFNGNFGYGNDSGWRLNNLNSTEPNIDNVNKWLVLLPTISNVATHNIMNFPTNYTSISMDVKLDVGTYMGTVIPKLIIEYYSANGQKIKQAVKTLSLIPTVQFSRIHFGLPNELQGKNGTFRLRFADNEALNDYNTSNLKILVDNVELSNETTTVSPPVISANKTTIPSGQSANLSATGCTNGIIYWTTGEVGASIIVNPIETTGYAAFCEQDGYFSTPSNAISITVTYASTLANAEYFIDTDPGIGLATTLSGIPSSGVINQTIPINLAPLNLPQGVHSIGFRVKDQNDKWSLTHTKTFLVLGEGSTGNSEITGVEYFIDSLKQDNSNLQTFAVTASTDVNIAMPVLQNLAQGVHSISVRVKDNNNKRSLFHTKTYLVLGAGIGGNTLSKIEYFFDTDPGFGGGTHVNYTAAVGDAQVVEIPTTGLNNGVHVLNVRVKNEANQWSLTHAKVFLIMPDMGGNATVSKIEYFIGNQDPGPGAAMNVAFSPNPDNKSVVANFDLDVNTYTPGIYRISARVLDSEGRWSPVVAKSFIFTPPLSIVKLPENIYESNYDVLQQSIVHRYYQVRRSGTDTPIAGVKLKYKLSNKPNEVFESTVSDAKGVVDLTLRTGGANQIILTDDIIPFGIAPVSISYEKASDTQGNELPVNTNQFLNNDFTVTTYNIQRPEEIEYGVTTGLGGSVGVGYKVGVTVGPVKAEAGLWSASLGGTLGSIVTIKPDANNPNIWTVEGNFTREAELEGSIGPTFEADVAKAVSVEGGITASASIANGARDFKEYTIDLTNNKHVYFLAHKLLSIRANKDNPDILRASNFLKRMSENLVILNQKGIGHSVSADASVGASLGASIGFSDGATKSGAELGAELAVGIEIETVKSKNLITSENIEESSITAEASASVGLAPILSYEYSSDVTFGTKLPTPLFLGASKNYGLTMTKTTLNNNLVGYSSEIASTQNITLGTINYEETISNFTELNGPLTLATTTYYKNNNTGTTSNIYANYLNTGKFGFASFVGGFQNQNNFFTQYVNFNKTAADIFQSSFGLDAFKQGKNRTLTKKQGFNLDFGLSLVLELGLNINFENWTGFTTPISEHKYLSSIGQIVQTVDRPLSTNFYETPTQTPIQIVFNKVKDALLLEPISVLTANYGFVQKVFEPISTTASKIYSSLGFSQLNLQAQEVAKISSVDKTSNTNTNPSALSFTVPPAPTTFATGTEIRFSFYYPENKLKTAIGVDTFQIVSDIFYLNAILNGQRLITASNGTFTVNSTYSTYDLSRASLPLGSMVKLLFMPEGSTQWEVISNVDVSFSTNRLGAYAIAAKLLEDNVPPTINVTNPQSNVPAFTVNIMETQSGINWAATVFKVGGKQVAYQRQGLTNTFSVPIASIIHITDGVYKLEITTADLAGNYTVYSSIYPCEGAFEISSVVTGVPSNYESKGRITTNANIPGGSVIQVKSEKEIVFLPGFEVKDGKSFRASIGGCKSNE